MDWVLRILKSERISGGALVLLAFGLFWLHGWADANFARLSDLAAITNTMESGFESLAIENASAEIRDIKLSKQIAEHDNPGRIGLERIDLQLEHAIAYKQCLVIRGTNCEHLREVE